MNNVPSGIITHQRRVCKLYKNILRNIEAFYDRRTNMRYHQVLMRKEFDDNSCVSYPEKAEQLVEKGENKLFRLQHYNPKKFPGSPGGIAYEREVIPPDWVLDYWHPLEKARYPQYFACREKRKEQYIQFWKKEYGDEKCE